MRTVEVLGPGCPRCLETYRVVREVVERNKLECTLVKVDAIARMVELGVLQTPAIAVDGAVVLSGRVPEPGEVERLLGIA